MASPLQRSAMAHKRAASFVVEQVLGIDVNDRYALLPPDLDQRARHVIDPADSYLEDEPTVKELFKELVPTRDGVVSYATELFPSASWVRRYNLNTGITIGLVVVPQALAYAALAQLDAAFGLYTSFTGAVTYWMFGTSKDIVIGTTAVGSLLVGNVVSSIRESHPDQYSAPQIAHALSMLSGAVLLFFGLLRLGWIIEFIPYVPISAFVTAASITIMSTQFPVALGLQGVNTREAPYKVIISSLQKLNTMQADAAIGLSCIALLFAIKSFCSAMEVRMPNKKRLWSFLSSLRLTFAMLLFTLISYLVNRGLPKGQHKFQIVGKIEQGFKEASVPHPDTGLIKAILPELPAVAIILVIEHIAISKAMGRLHGYTINPSQEIVALGMANMFSPFVGGYVCTGSFGASAVLSKAGVRTPLAGLFSAMVLVLALYALTGVFYFIPKAALAGLIIHAVCNLVTPPAKLYKYWELSPIELLIWVAGVVLAIFDSLETSIYVGVILSVAVLLFRIARKRGTFLGVVYVKRVGDDKQLSPTGKDGLSSRQIFLPLEHRGATNPDIKVLSPYPGVFVYRLSEGFNYTNQAYHVDTLLRHVMENTRRMSPEEFEKESDRLWNDPGPRVYENDSGLPYLRAMVFDFAAVNNVDITSVQGLIDLRNTFDRHAAPDTVEWHFANVHNRWTRRALAAAGFGYPTSKNPEAVRNWHPVYSIAATLTEKDWPIIGSSRRSEIEVDEERTAGARTPDSVGSSPTWGRPDGECDGRSAAVSGVDRPFFHNDLQDAVDSAVKDARSKDSR
ncbi:sulfate permease [Purpureocillium lavendulum]|uniref:Sulfate permease n=1 Tax=Purpureocillium lavendulum TaxID=1247861 RepID=A0AB34G623_9HYPO|nr:sulfate permease [Purpureocillium lavendulum]